MKSLIERIRRAKTWQERAEIAENKFPGTPFDGVFERAALAKKVETVNPRAMRQIYIELGELLARKIQEKNVNFFHDLGSAIAEWKSHKGKPDYDLMTLCSMAGLFPRGWTKRAARFVNGKPIRGLPAGARDTIAMRDLKQNLERIDPDFNEDDWNTRRRKIQRHAKNLKIPLDDRAGKPKNELRHNPSKKLR